MEEIKRRGLSHYAVVQMVKGRIVERTLYGYLAGENDMAGARVAIVAEALGLELRRVRRRKGR